MKVLILGATGMLGHKMHEVLSAGHEVVSVARSRLAELPVDAGVFFTRGRVLEGLDATDPGTLEGLLDEMGPDVVVNCIGVIKQREQAQDPVASISVNSLFPHQLAAACSARGARMIHFSTDCVFSGRDGGYTEDSVSDAEDLYGRTKFLGEVATAGALTIRSSIIGRELHEFDSLVEWFLAQEGQIRGFTGAFYTGLTTPQMAALVGRVLEEYPTLSGLFQVASEPISKYELLVLMRDAFGRQEMVDIVADDVFNCDRSLRGDRFREATGIDVPSWSEMIHALAEDSVRYGRVKP